MQKTECLLCGKSFSDLLKHLRLTHDVDSVEAYARKASEASGLNEKRERFRDYVQALQSKKEKGMINAEDYRRLIIEWKDR